MNEDICRWIIEFMLRSSMSDQLLNRVLAAIPVPDMNFRLKKTVLLRAIDSEISEAVVTERLLELFEMIEQLDKNEGLAITESMKAAYCAVAVECSAKYLLVDCPAVGHIYRRERYYDAVMRIWRVRVAKLVSSGKSELVSRELKGWKDEVEATFCDKNVRNKIVKMNTRYDALKLTVDYLGEAWALLGPPFLHLSASLMDKRTTNEMRSAQLEQEIDKTAIVRENVGGNGGIDLRFQTDNSARQEQEGSGQVISQVETTRNELVNINQDSGVDSSKQAATVAMSSERVQELTSETAEGQESVEKEADDVLHSPSPSENLNSPILPRCKLIASHRRVRGGAKISHLEGLDNDSSSKKDTCLDTPEVNRVREALKTSSLELEAVVKDPLPDALRIAETVAQDLAEKNKTREQSLEDRNDASAANPTINKDDVPLRSVNANLNNQCHGHQTTVPRPSIMERNSTACTYEWNDSIDDSPQGNHFSRLHLPSSKRKVISPLKKYEETRLVRRRKSKKWSLLEEDTLRTAVQRFGKGNWTLILNTYRDIFDERTKVDLKDKWRNMIR